MTPQAKGLYFGPENLEQKVLSCLQFIENRLSQLRQHYQVVPIRVLSTIDTLSSQYSWYLIKFQHEPG